MKDRKEGFKGPQVEKEPGPPPPFKSVVTSPSDEVISNLEIMIDDANNIITDGLSHTLENCDSFEECYICDWQRVFEKYFKDKKGK